MILASFSDYLPLSDLWRIVVVCLAVAVIAPAAAALVITGFEAQAKAHAEGHSRMPGDARIAIGALVLVGLAAAGIVALLND